MASSAVFGLLVLMMSCVYAKPKPQGFGLGSNLALGPLGNFGSGFNFQPPPNGKSQTPTTATTGSPNGIGMEKNGVGLQTNLGLGPLGSIGSGFNFGGAATTTAAPAPGASNPIGISSNLGLGSAGNLGSGFNFQPPPTTAAPSPNPLGLETGGMPMMLNASTDDKALNGSTVLTTTMLPLTTTVAPTWTEWTNWTACSTKCGLGQEKRSRTCTGGTTCFGLAEMQRPCFGAPCPIGVWTEWSKPSACSANCGVGSQTLTRTCNNGTCFGPAEMRQSCSLMPCPVGTWSEWTEWSTCSTSCGFGQEKRTRVCNGGICHGLAEMVRPCHTKIC